VLERSPVRIRTARVQEAAELTRLARQSKAAWGYPDAWLREWESELEISAEYIQRNAVFVAELEGGLVGVIGVGVGPEGPEIGHLWISAESQGQGLGRALVDRAREVAVQEQWTSLRIVSDPYAQPFYERLGAVPVGEIEAPVAGTERTLPVLRLEV
jgi:predicted N-acetyltransferase YhbS